ncbi:unnamed protein product [marine sediment metagenome]|uniref:Uncharacterized protein n=1 Tax=marine sediment metagenome TaxID=412755 RepID=X1A599_9ZZZZ
MKPVTAYFTAPIRGPKGDRTTQDEINRNLETGKAFAAKIRKMFGSLIKIYCPHDQDDLIQVLWERKQVTAFQVIDGDLVILRPKDFVLVYWPYKENLCGGCKIEFDEAIRLHKPVVKFCELNDAVYFEIFKVISEIIKQKYFCNRV